MIIIRGVISIYHYPRRLAGRQTPLPLTNPIASDASNYDNNPDLFKPVNFNILPNDPIAFPIISVQNDLFQ
ncbi:hypothetical protein M407DRAFT_199389 [Tulasnella calospora MUT 4182]|uniref:Uncharacterized protein n=1 Tax=Tulasnella calospora MUT 4182 TaxID=1051891 RepID=A0A0C3QIF5_9AGAM|nr:hypothetical protein M407DRAFT_199389 [Tulasnella calospora MUT 4182]